MVSISPARVARPPDSICAITIARLTGTPERAAEEALAPAARICLPVDVRRNRICKAAQTASATNTRTDTKPNTFSLPISVKLLGSALNASASVRTIMAPKNRLMVARVMMKLFTPVFTTVIPFTQPSADPKASAAITDGMTGRPTTCISQPPNITEDTAIDPTARFMPPVANTTIIEQPMTMSMATTRPRA